MRYRSFAGLWAAACLWAAPVHASDVDRTSTPSFGVAGQIWLRAEGRTAADPAVLQRVRLTGRGQVGPVSGLVQVQDARHWGFEASSISNEGNVDLHQGYLDVGGQATGARVEGFIRAGRQEIDWGTMRLIGHLPWAATARAFDAVRARIDVDGLGADAMIAMLQAPGSFETATGDTLDSRGAWLGGAQLFANLHPAFNAELGVLTVDLDATSLAPAQDVEIAAPDAHVHGSHGGLSYDAETSVQLGAVGGRPHRAWAWAAWARHAFEGPRVEPSVRAGYAMASGDRCTRTPDEEAGCGAAISTEFFNFYPTNHGFYGLMDLAGWRNIRDLDARVGLKLPRAVSLEVAYHHLALHEPAGPWKNAGGALVGRGWDPANTAHTLGHELDFTAEYRALRGRLFVQPGYGLFLPGPAARRLGRDSPSHFVWLWMIVNLG